MDDKLLIAAYFEGDEGALALLMERHHERLTAYFRQQLNEQETEDCEQEVWFRVVRTAKLPAAGLSGQVDPFCAPSFDRWLLGIARNVVIDKLRLQARDPIPVDGDALDQSTPPDFRSAMQHFRVAIRSGIEQLSDEDRTILTLEQERLGSDTLQRFADWAGPRGMTADLYKSSLRRARAALLTLFRNMTRPQPSQNPAPIIPCRVVKLDDAEEAECAMTVSGVELPRVEFPAAVLRAHGLTTGDHFRWVSRDPEQVNFADISKSSAPSQGMTAEQEGELDRLYAKFEQERTEDGDKWPVYTGERD